MRKCKIILFLIVVFVSTQSFAGEGKMIFFGHQSVGNNILQGIEKTDAATIIKLGDSQKSVSSDKNVIFHKMIGKNRHPVLKIDDFKNSIVEHNNDINIATLKLCYIDFKAEMDYERVFLHYKKTVSDLERQYPHIKIMHMTVPLKTQKTSVKVMLKKFLGVSAWEYQDNIIRNKYNELIRTEYTTSGRLFDIAKYESTYLDGKRNHFSYEGNDYESMVPEYSSDGGHLNEIGRVYIAEKFIEKIDSIKSKHK